MPANLMDPSKPLDPTIFNIAVEVKGPVFKDRETVLWKNSNAYYRQPNEKGWTSMSDTGQMTLPDGWAVYLSGGEIRKQS